MTERGKKQAKRLRRRNERICQRYSELYTQKADVLQILEAEFGLAPRTIEDIVNNRYGAKHCKTQNPENQQDHE